MELNGLPEGSLPTRRRNRSPTMPSASVSVKTFETLWIENGVSAFAGGDDLALGVDRHDAEGADVDALELGAAISAAISRTAASGLEATHVKCALAETFSCFRGRDAKSMACVA